MNLRRALRSVGSYLVALCMVAGPSALADEPREWLADMNRAFTELSYDGMFSYFSGDDLASLRVVHMVIDGVQRRLVGEVVRAKQSVKQGNINMLTCPGALAFEQGSTDGTKRRESCRRVANGDARPARTLRWLTVQELQCEPATHGVTDMGVSRAVRIRASLSEATDRAQDDMNSY